MNDNLAGDQTFRWQSNDAIMGMIDTGRVAAGVWNLSAGPPQRLVFQAVAGNVTIAGDMVFGEFEKGVVDVIKNTAGTGQQRVRYLVVRADLAFIETEEDANNNEDLLRMFNPHPIVTLDPTPNPGNGESVNIMVKGKVKDFIAPVETVTINGQTANVTQTEDGGDGQGPFEGTFEKQIALTGHHTLIEAHAINSLKNIGKDSVLIAVTRDANFAITGRTVTEQASVPAAPPDDQNLLDFHEFKIELNARDIAGNTANVSFETGVETKNVVVTRQGTTNQFLSKDLMLCPQNLTLAAGAAQVIKDTRFKGDFGVEAKISITVPAGPLEDTGIPIGMLLLKKTDGAIADFVDSGIEADVTDATAARSYEIRVGLPGETNGAQIVVDLQGVDHEWADLTQPQPAASFPPVMKTLTLDRVGSDSSMADYNLYKTDPSKPLMGVRSKLPQDASCNAQDNASLEELYSEFDGGIKLIRSADSIELIEPMIGIEVAAEKPAMANTFKAAGVIPDGNPAPPIVSIADGGPRPQVTISTAAADTKYTGAAGNPAQFQIKGTVTDAIANLVDGNTLAAVGLSLQVNGVNVPAGNVTITRPANDPPRPFSATFTAMVNLSVIPQLVDVESYMARVSGGGLPARPLMGLKVAQEQIICKVTNALGNTAFDSTNCQVIDPDANNTFTPATPNTATLTHNTGTLYDIVPPNFFVLFHNPFKTEMMFNQQLKAKKGDGTELFLKNVTIERKLWGNFHRYGPFITGTVHRATNPAPAVADAVPVLPMIKFNYDAQGQVTGRDIVENVEATAPVPSRDDTTDCPGLDLRFADSDTGRDTYMPQRDASNANTDADPTVIALTARLTPKCLAQNRDLVLQLRNVTNWPGHCTNAPRPGAAGLNNKDYSFTGNMDDDGPEPAANFDNDGKVTDSIFSKDWGGVAVLQGTLDNLPGKPKVLMEFPLDSDGDFLPDVWERQFRASPGTANANNPIRDGLEDLEDRPLAGGAVIHNEKGDGYTALEEYRGFQTTNNAAPPVSTVNRMENIPFGFGLAVTGSTAAGNIVAGPRVKDGFVFLQTTMAFSNNNAQFFNVAMHAMNVQDLPVDQRVGPAGGMVYTTFMGHNHQMNVHGTNDGLNTVQNCAHLRDDTNLLPATVPPMLSANTLGAAGSFFWDGVDLRLNPNGNGVNTGTWAMPNTRTGVAVNVPMNANIRNGNTVWHELGHKCSFRHSMGTNQTAAAVQAGNNTDLDNADGDGNPATGVDGLARVTANTFIVEATAFTNSRTNVFGHTSLGSEGRRLLVGGAAGPAVVAWITQMRDSFGGRVIVDVMATNNPFAAAAALSWEDNLYLPEIMDGWDYAINNGENLQQNAGFGGGQLAGRFIAQQYTQGQLHNQEVRIRTQE